MSRSRYQTDEYRDRHAAWARQWRKKNSTSNNNAQRRWKANNPEKYKAIQENGSLKKLYGITAADRDKMLAEQGGVCAICGGTEPRRKGHKWAVDHCHSTGRVRGILCHPCNGMLGFAGDNLDTLEAAIQYIKRAKEERR